MLSVSKHNIILSVFIPQHIPGQEGNGQIPQAQGDEFLESKIVLSTLLGVLSQFLEIPNKLLIGESPR